MYITLKHDEERAYIERKNLKHVAVAGRIGRLGRLARFGTWLPDLPSLTWHASLHHLMKTTMSQDFASLFFLKIFLLKHFFFGQSNPHFLDIIGLTALFVFSLYIKLMSIYVFSGNSFISHIPHLLLPFVVRVRRRFEFLLSWWCAYGWCFDSFRRRL